MRVQKCKFGYYEISFVGHHISVEGVCPVSENVQDILNLQPPTNIKELEQLSGTVNYYRNYYPTMAPTAEVLNWLHQEGQPYNWTKECQHPFKSLCASLGRPPTLAFPDWNKEFYIETDTCDVSVRGVLSQWEEDTQLLKPVGYCSILLDRHQRNYSASKKRVLGINFCNKEMENILLSSKPD